MRIPIDNLGEIAIHGNAISAYLPRHAFPVSPGQARDIADALIQAAEHVEFGREEEKPIDPNELTAARRELDAALDRLAAEAV